MHLGKKNVCLIASTRNMSRFFDFSLYKRTDELLRPSEKELSSRFYATENIQLLYKKAVTEVDTSVAYSDVTVKMDTVFRGAIQTEDLPSVSEMNRAVLGKLSKDLERASTSQKRYTERSFQHSNVPTQILPRPSYGSHDNDNDDSIVLLRR